MRAISALTHNRAAASSTAAPRLALRPPRRCLCTRAMREEHAESRTVRERITIFTSEGMVTIPGRELQVPRPQRVVQPFPSWEEQGLVVGATFAVAATNGRDPGRRISILGFCQSVDVLQEAVEETVVERGGEVLGLERRLKSGVHEQLCLTVCIPFLWGVPPEVDALSAAIIEGGGIVDRVVKQWSIYSEAAYVSSLRGHSC